MLARVDLDGDGRDDEVRRSPRGRGCEATFAVVEDRVLPVGAVGAPRPDAAYAVAPGGETPVLLVTSRQHPRGGFQVRVWAESRGRYAELTRDGDPRGQSLVPFVATDTFPGTPVAAECAPDGGLRVIQAVLPATAPEEASDLTAPQQQGWQVLATTYRVAGARAEEAPGMPELDVVPFDSLGATYPDLTDNAMFTDCRVG